MSVIKLISTRTRIREVADRWAEQYSRECWIDDADKQGILAKLRALDPETATARDVEAIIGNTSWTNIVCDVCDEGVGEAVLLDDEGDPYEGTHALVCRHCITTAARLFPGEP